MEINVIIKDLKTRLQKNFQLPVSQDKVSAAFGYQEGDEFLYVLISEHAKLIKEDFSIELVNDFAEMVEVIDEEVVFAVQEVTGYDAKDFVKYDFCFEDCSLLTDVNSPRELGEYWFDQLGVDGVGKENMERYFDHEAYGRDINLENAGGFSSWGFIDIPNLWG